VVGGGVVCVRGGGAGRDERLDGPLRRLGGWGEPAFGAGAASGVGTGVAVA